MVLLVHQLPTEGKDGRGRGRDREAFSGYESRKDYHHLCLALLTFKPYRQSTTANDEVATGSRKEEEEGTHCIPLLVTTEQLMTNFRESLL